MDKKQGAEYSLILNGGHTPSDQVLYNVGKAKMWPAQWIAGTRLCFALRQVQRAKWALQKTHRLCLLPLNELSYFLCNIFTFYKLARKEAHLTSSRGKNLILTSTA